jgi:carboxylesterase type B
VIPDDQYKMYEARRFNDTPILVGYNSDEGLSFGVPATPDAYRQATRQPTARTRTGCWLRIPRIPTQSPRRRAI